MSKFQKAKELSAKYRAAFLEAVNDLKEASKAQRGQVVASIRSDEQVPTNLNKEDGFKITSEVGKAEITKARAQREDDINTKKARDEQVAIVASSPRTKKFRLLPEKTRGDDKGKWLYQITGELKK